MKAKLLFAVFAALILTSLPARAGADDPPSGHNPLRKLGRGFANLLFGIVEVPNQFTRTNSEHGGGGGVTYGIGKGFARWFQREAIGVYEIITFPVPAP